MEVEVDPPYKIIRLIERSYIILQANAIKSCKTKSIFHNIHMEGHELMIPDINPQTRNWIVRITVMEDIPPMKCSFGSKLKRYVFADAQGNKIIAAVFDEDIPTICPLLQQFKVYDIKNAKVTPVYQDYRILDNPNQWTIRKKTPIYPVPQANPDLSLFLDGIVPFRNISDFLNTGRSIDIMGIVVKDEECKTVTVNDKQSKVQQFTFVDSEKIPVKVSIWNEMTISLGQVLEEAARKFSVVVAKRLSPKIFAGISLSTRNSSSFTVNPPIEAAEELKAWFDSISEDELQSFLHDQTVPISKDLMTKGAMKVYTVAEFNELTEYTDYWLKGFFQLAEEDQQLFYIGCSKCNTAIDLDDTGLHHKCNVCNTNVVTSFRPIVVMSITDHTSTVKAVAMGHIAEMILQNSISNIARLIKQGIQYDLEYIKSDFNGKHFMVLLRRSQGRRRLLIKTYYEVPIEPAPIQHRNFLEQQAITASSSAQSEKATSNELSLSPLKRQMNSVIIDSEYYAGVSPKKQLTNEAKNTSASTKKQLTYATENQPMDEDDAHDSIK